MENSELKRAGKFRIDWPASADKAAARSSRFGNTIKSMSMGNTNDDQPASSAKDSGSGFRPKGFTLRQDPVVGLESEVAKYEVAPEPVFLPAPARPAYEDLGELPASYHVDTLFLTARDPHWLFCYWDFDWTRVPTGAFRYGVPMFFLKITRATGAEEATVEIKPASRNWYVPVSTPGTAYVAEIGYYNVEGTFVTCVRSSPASTPPESLAAENVPSGFATVPSEMSFEELLNLVKSQMTEGETLLGAVARITGERSVAFRAGMAPVWTDEQRRILAALLGDSLIQRIGLGSAEIDELLRKAIQERLHSESASALGAVWQRALYVPPGESSLFSGITSWGASWSAQPFSLRAERGFFMHVNAEIIFYGGTHPDATVWIEGKQIKLNPDGTFRYHFRLPDGDWRIPIVAESPDKVEQRSATLSLHRGTSKSGHVTDTPQPAGLPAQPMGRR
jgi:uncharacterized protein